MRGLRILTAVVLVAGCVAAYALTPTAATLKPPTEAFVSEPLPPGFQVVNTELEGPLFADAAGHTLYQWPRHGWRAGGYTGEQPGQTSCYDVHYRESAGLQAPYPGGTELPDADHRPTCVQHWPPVIAGPDAKPVGKWSIIDRTDRTKQWAYDGNVLYTSHLDHQPGETNGGTRRAKGRDTTFGGGFRDPIGPVPAVPAQIQVITMQQGRMLATGGGDAWSVYAFDGDKPNKSNCTGSCLEDWAPIAAPDSALARGEWSVVQRSNGTKQWAYRGMPLYTHIADSKTRSYEGGDVPGWHNVFTQLTPRPPKGFRIVDTNGGQVIAESHGKTIYYYSCVEDAPDALFCDAPDSPQEYRWAMCGGGDPERCLKTFPYVVADKNAKSDSMAWSIRDIDPMSGRYVAAGTPGSLHIWAFRGRPVYTFARDHEEGDIEADGWGQDHGLRNGFTAFWTRDSFQGNQLGVD